MATVIGGPWPEHLNSPANTYYQTRPVITMTSSDDDTLGHGSFGTWDILPSTRRWTQTERFHANAMPSVPVLPDYITNGYGYPKQTTSCTWPYVVPIGEDPAAHGHWCAFTDLYHTIPYHTAKKENSNRPKRATCDLRMYRPLPQRIAQRCAGPAHTRSQSPRSAACDTCFGGCQGVRA